ncbi:MAG: hypothetical protein WCJ64_17075 [Rhodospirillaceae bacterium]
MSKAPASSGTKRIKKIAPAGSTRTTARCATTFRSQFTVHPDVVLADKKPMVPLSIPRAGGVSTDIEVKEVVVEAWEGETRRYVVCYNPERAAWEAAQRTAILESLRQ